MKNYFWKAICENYNLVPTSILNLFENYNTCQSLKGSTCHELNIILTNMAIVVFVSMFYNNFFLLPHELSVTAVENWSLLNHFCTNENM